MNPSIDWSLIFFAALEIGAVICPIPLKAPASPLLEKLKPTLWIDPMHKAHRLDRQITTFDPSIFLLIFTSGSSGDPKIAAFTFDALISSAKAVVKNLSITSQDCLHLSLPLHHVGGLGILLRSWISNAKLTFDASDPAITILSYVPTQLYRAWPIHPKLRAILLGGAPIHDVPTKLPIFATYGLTETGSTVFLQKDPVIKNNLLYLGHPLSHLEIKLAKDGEILVRGSSLFKGYLEDYKIAPVEEWFQTKDLAKFDPTDGFAIIGRKDNQFISGGENIQPEEIEKILKTHPTIIDAIVVAKNDPEYGARPVACVQSSSSISLSEIQSFLKPHLPKYKIPISLYPLPENELKPNRKKIFQSINHSK